MTVSGLRTIRVVISGCVQGVWYRGWTEAECRKRRIEGWVRNRRDGTVEALFHGTQGDVESMLTACREGPPAARVDDIQCEELGPGEAEQAGAGFRVLPSA